MTRRDLKLAELEIELCLMHQKKLDLSETSKIRNMNKTLNQCDSFLRVMKTDAEKKDKLISLIHDSFKLFVINSRVCHNSFLVNETWSNA